MGSFAGGTVPEAKCIAFMRLALEQVSLFLSMPREHHKLATERVLMYIKGLVVVAQAAYEVVCAVTLLKKFDVEPTKAKLALDSLEVPVGCIIVEDDKVISSGRNRTTETRNATRHAEMEAIDVLLEQWQKNGFTKEEITLRFSKCTLYVTCEPCIMCAAALSIIGVEEVYYGCANDKFGGCGSILSLHTNSGKLPSGGTSKRKGFKCTGGVMATEAVNLFKSFYEQGNPNAPKPHRTVVARE